MPGGVVIKVSASTVYSYMFLGITVCYLQSTTTLEDNKISTVSVSPDGSKVTRVYEFDDNGCVIVS